MRHLFYSLTLGKKLKNQPEQKTWKNYPSLTLITPSEVKVDINAFDIKLNKALYIQQ
jgi:hypothetical protein